jgi:hypothetical protein
MIAFAPWRLGDLPPDEPVLTLQPGAGAGLDRLGRSPQGCWLTNPSSEPLRHDVTNGLWEVPVATLTQQRRRIGPCHGSAPVSRTEAEGSTGTGLAHLPSHTVHDLVELLEELRAIRLREG